MEFELRKLNYIANSFIGKSDSMNIEKINSGNINQTFLVKYNQGKDHYKLILQSINTKIFDDPISLIHNHVNFLSFIEKRRLNLGKIRENEPSYPGLIYNKVTEKPWLEFESMFWRAIEYVPNSICFETTTSTLMAYQVGSFLSLFHRQTRNFPLNHLKPVLKGFHSLEKYFYNYDQSLDRQSNAIYRPSTLKSREDSIIDFIDSNRNHYKDLVDLADSYKLTQCLIHGDTKLSNFLFAKPGNKIISLIDLDTIHSGYLVHDLADCIRSCCNKAGESPDNLNSVGFDIKMFDHFIQGYLSKSKGSLSHSDFINLPYSVASICFELCLRFFTDHICGDVYFNTSFPGQNLYRAEVQLKLVNDIQAQSHSLVSIVRKSLSKHC